jgi:hypothetical protein
MQNDIQRIYNLSGIINESKYGQKFDQYYGPFKNDNDKVKDKNGKELCECKDAATAKELAAILTDIKQMRELCEKIVSLPNR